MTKSSFLYCLLGLILFYPQTSTYSQSFMWVDQVGFDGYLNAGYALSSDQAGNIYVTGAFEGTVDFGGNDVISKGERDVFIAKYSNAGDLIWVETAGGSGYDEGSSLKLDQNGENVVVTGFMHYAQFGDTTLSGAPFFVAKYDTSGRLIWAKAITTDGSGSEPSAAFDTLGNIFVTGGSYGIARVDTFVVRGAFFIAKFGPEGNVEWLKGIQESSSLAAVQPHDIACDFSNNVYVTGFIQSDTIRFDSTHSLIPQVSGNLFLVKYDGEGNVAWAVKSDNTEIAYATSLAMDIDNSVYLTGTFSDSINFGGVRLDGNDDGRLFLTKYNPDGFPAWAVKREGPGYSQGTGITLDRSRNIYITGVADDSSRFGDIEIPQGGIIMLRYNSEGTCLNALSAVSSPTTLQSWGNDVAVTDSMNIFLTGSIRGTVHFGTMPISNNTGRSIFITRITIDKSTEVYPIQDNITDYRLSQNYPNPFNSTTNIEVSLPRTSFISIKIFDILGEEVVTLLAEQMTAGRHRVTWNASNLPSGIYYYRLQGNGFYDVKPLVLQK